MPLKLPLSKDLEPIVLFDGFCNLCNRTVKFILKNDLDEKFKFASLQSSFGQNLLEESNLPSDDFDTVVYIDKGKSYLRSTAAIKILTDLGWPWNIFYPLILIPPTFRDLIYSWIAKSRYKRFGKRTSCMIPEKKYKDRFLE